MRLAITCPVYSREWILPRWYKCILAQGFDPKNIDLIFGITDGEDGTREVIAKYEHYFNDTTIIDCNDLEPFGDRNPQRFYPLAEIRNRIIDLLKDRDYDYWWSYDTDILVPDDCLKTLITDLQSDDVDIVAPWVALVPSGDIPNCAHRRQLSDQFWRRKPYSQYYPKGSLYPMDTVFAIFAAKPWIYETFRYGWHQGGEDYYWGNQVIDGGVKSWVDGRIIGDHIYKRDC